MNLEVFAHACLIDPLACLVTAIVLSATFALAADAPPAVGETAKDFSLSAVDGEKVELSRLRKEGPVVLIVLRGYPGYQCPVCNVQVGQFLASAEKLKAAKANVVLVYPGPADGLKNTPTSSFAARPCPECLSHARSRLRLYQRLSPPLGRQERNGLSFHLRDRSQWQDHVCQSQQNPRRPRFSSKKY